MSMNDETRADYEAVKADVRQLIADGASWISSASQETKDKWEETKPVLEAKLAGAEEEAKRLGAASSGAAQEMGKGFQSAFEELKNSFAEAQKHFSPPEEEEAEGREENENE